MTKRILNCILCISCERINVMTISLAYLELNLAMTSLSPSGFHSNNAFAALSDMMIATPSAWWLLFVQRVLPCLEIFPSSFLFLSILLGFVQYFPTGINLSPLHLEPTCQSDARCVHSSSQLWSFPLATQPPPSRSWLPVGIWFANTCRWSDC